MLLSASSTLKIEEADSSETLVAHLLNCIALHPNKLPCRQPQDSPSNLINKQQMPFSSHKVARALC